MFLDITITTCWKQMHEILILINVNLDNCRKRKDRHEGGAPSGFSRFPTAEGDSDEDEDYEKERRKRSEFFFFFTLFIYLYLHNFCSLLETLAWRAP